MTRYPLRKTSLLTGPTMEETPQDRPFIVRKANPQGRSHAQGSIENLRKAFQGLPPDPYMHAGDDFRFRCYGRFYLDFRGQRARLGDAPQASFIQSKRLNVYAGGIERRFAPLPARVRQDPLIRKLILEHFKALPQGAYQGSGRRVVKVHLVRNISRSGQPGHPSPEGPHRDGHDFQCLTLINREGILGGENQVYINGARVFKHTLQEPLETLIFDDRAVMHYATPIHSLRGYQTGFRDMVHINFSAEES